MELKFFGTGSCFNTELGNTSAFLKENDRMLLIDCGEDTFSKINESSIMNDVKTLDVLITHTHSDHCGSLPSLIFYCQFYKNKLPVNIYNLGKNTKKLIDFLNIMGIDKSFYSIKVLTELNNKYSSFDKVNTKELLHRWDTNSSAFYFNTAKGWVVFTGDTSDVNEVAELAINKNVHKIYADVCGLDYIGNVHLSLKALSENIDAKNRDKIYCMHADHAFDKKLANEMGFNVAEPIKLNGVNKEV